MRSEAALTQYFFAVTKSVSQDVANKFKGELPALGTEGEVICKLSHGNQTFLLLGRSSLLILLYSEERDHLSFIV